MQKRCYTCRNIKVKHKSQREIKPLQRGQFIEAKESLLESQRIAQAYAEGWFDVLADEFLGILAHGEGAHSLAQLYLIDSLDHFRQ